MLCPSLFESWGWTQSHICCIDQGLTALQEVDFMNFLGSLLGSLLSQCLLENNSNNACFHPSSLLGDVLQTSQFQELCCDGVPSGPGTGLPFRISRASVGTVPEGNTTGEDELLRSGCRLPAEHGPGIPISPAKCTYDFIKIKNVCLATTLLRWWKDKLLICKTEYLQATCLRKD